MIVPGTVRSAPAPLEQLSASLQRLYIPSADVKEWQADPLTALKSTLLVPHKSIKALSDGVLLSQLEADPELQAKITDFRKKFARHIACIAESTWSELKAIYKDAMMDPFAATGCSLSDFRGYANAFLDKSSLELGQKLGLQKAIWTVCGTSGYASDVDITLNMGSGVPNIEEAVLYKTLRDCLHTHIFGGLSGVQLDTECYIPHPAQINIAHYLYLPRAFRYFQTGEKASVLLQQYIGLYKIGAEYERSKKQDIDSITSCVEKEAMLMLYDKIEALMRQLECRVAKLKNDMPYKEARELAFVSLRLQLAERCSLIQQEIDSESKRVHAFASQDTASCKEALLSSKKELDSLWLEFQSVLIVVTVLQNEGTLSVAEGKATLLEEGGQIHAGAVRARKGSMSEFYQGNREVLDELAKASPRFRRKASLPLQATLGAASIGRSDEYARIVLGSDVEELLQPVFARPSGQTFLMAAYEESMQLQHCILQGLLNGDHPSVVAIASGKYALRTTRNLCQALLEYKKELVYPKGVLRLLEQAEKLEKISEALEKCKRATSISSEAATELLSEVILTNLNGRGSVDEIDVRVRLQKMFRDFDFGGIYFGRVLPQEDHVRNLCDTLVKLKDLFVNVADLAVLEILQAHAGFDRFNPKFRYLQAVHQKAQECTLAHFELTCEAQVRQFLDDILQLGRDIRNLTRDHDFFTISSAPMVHFYDFVRLVANLG